MAAEDKDYFEFQIGDIVIEDMSLVFWDDEPLTGLVIDVKRQIYFLGQSEFEIRMDRLTVFWFSINRVENIPSDFVNLFSR